MGYIPYNEGYKKELEEMWEKEEYRKLPPLN